MGEDKRILGAVQHAVDIALEQIEQGCAQARITQEGITTYQNTQNLVVAKFLHDISREGDPQLHVHCVVMNMTQRSDGQWRSLASQSGKYGPEVTSEVNGFLERVRHHKHYYGMIFRAELAHELQQLGYTIVKTGKKGFFEVEGISQKTLDAYSQRSQQIEAYMNEHGFTGAKAAAVATIKTRKAKNINRETLQELWQVRGEKCQVDAFNETKQVVDHALHPERTPPPSHVDLTAAREAVTAAINHLSETQVSIQEIQLMNTTLHYAMGNDVNVAAIQQAILENQTKGVLIPLNITHPNNGLCFTTQQLIDYERHILQAITLKHPSTKPLVSDDKINAYLNAENELNSEQRQAIRTIFSSDHQILALEGSTGSGKSYLLKPMVELTKLGDYRAVLLTPTKASNVILKQQLKSGSKSWFEQIKQLFDTNQYDTVSHFVKIQERWLSTGQNVLDKGVIFVDQATSLSSKQMFDLVNLTRQTNTRLILLGDSKTLLPWQSGCPFNQLLQAGINQASLTQNYRQQQKEIKTAITDTLKSNVISAFEKIGHRILSIENKEERLERMAAHFVSLRPEEQKSAFVLMPTQKQCEEMNIAIHEALKQNQKINKSSIEASVLLPKNKNDTQYRCAKNYEVGEWVRFNEAYKSLCVQRGDYCKIKAIHHNHNLVMLEHRGKTLAWNPDKVAARSGSVEVFETKSREISIGETILWKRNDARKNIYKGERLQISNISNHRLILTRENGKTCKINLNKITDCHFDYGYASTPYQHLNNASIIIAYQNSFSRQSHQRLFYKLLSQATEQVWIYTENRNQLLNNLQKQTGNKVTALESLLGEQLSPYSSEQNELLEKAIHSALNRIQKHVENDDIAKNAVSYALAHLSERETAFTHKEVLQVALEHVLGKTNLSEIQQAILEAEKNGDLIRGLYSTEGTRWTTREALNMEREIIQLARQHQGKIEPIAPSKVIEDHLQNTQPKAEHADAIRKIARTTDPIILMQGYAGTGKTTLLKNFQLLLQQQGYELLCLAPMHTAVKELKERGLNAQTLDSYLVKYRSVKNQSVSSVDYKQIIAVDESSMISNRRLRDFLVTTQLTQTRVFLIGYRQQLSAIESGKPFALLQQSGFNVIVKDIERQKDETLKKAVKEAYAGNLAASFQTLSNNIIEIGAEQIGSERLDNRHKRLEAIAENYLSRTPLERAQTLLITLGNDDRVLLNALIRERLQFEGELHGKGVVSTVLVPRDMTTVERTHLANYRPADIIRFNVSDSMLGIEKNQYLKVIEVENQYLVLQKDNGQQVCGDRSVIIHKNR